MKIGVLSDTHDFLDPVILKLFHGVDHILHAGDIGNPLIELELKFIAPVTVVLGNTDLGLTFKETEVLTLADKKFLIHHIVNPRALSEKVEARIRRDRPDAVIFGHTHNWSVTRHEKDIHLINLPPTSYVFLNGRPSGWVRCALAADGMELELRCLDTKHPEHGKTQTLKWRMG